MGRVRCPGCAGCVIPDVLGSLPLAYPPQALTCRLHSPWHARRIAVIGCYIARICENHLLKCTGWFQKVVFAQNGLGNVLYQWFETNGVFSNGRFRTLHKCLVGAQTSC